MNPRRSAGPVGGLVAVCLVVGILALAPAPAAPAPGPVPSPVPPPSPASSAPTLPERAPETLREITPGLPREIGIQGGESHFFRFQAEAGVAIRVRAVEEGVDVALLLLSPDGSLLAEVDRPSGAFGVETLPAVAEQGGAHELEIRALVPGQEGRYLLELAPLLAASPAEVEEAARHRAAWKALDEGQALRRGARSAEALEAALARFREALELWQIVGDPDQQGAAYNSMGVACRQLGRMKEAVEHYEAALALWRQTGNRTGEMDVLHNLGRARHVLGEAQGALEAHRQALGLARELADPRAEARSLTQVASAFRDLGELEDARQALEAALALTRQLGDVRGEANALNLSGILYREEGDEQLALDTFREALGLWRRAEDSRGEAATLNNLGNVYRALGELGRARDLYSEVLSVNRQLGDRDGEAYAHFHLGWVYRGEGDSPRALDAFRQALALWKEVGNRQEEAMALAAVGDTMTALGQGEEALPSLGDALELAREGQAPWGRFFSLHHLGETHRALGHLGEAREFLDQALAQARTLGNLAAESMTLTALARLEVDHDDLARARDLLGTALTLTESRRSQVASEELRTTYLAAKIDRYELLIDVLMELHLREPEAGHDLEALAASERARARGLLDSLASSHADLRRGADPELLRAETRLGRQINARERRRLTALAEGDPRGEAAGLDADVEALLVELSDIREAIHRQSPEASVVTEPEPITREDISEVLEEGTLLLVYRLGEKRSYLWALTRTTSESFLLPPREDIEVLARQVYRLLRLPGDRPSEELPASSRAALSKSEEDLERARDRLSAILLDPVVLRGATAGSGSPRGWEWPRLAVVADGALQAIPFAALTVPGGAAPGGRELLLRRAAVVSLPSISVLHLLRANGATPSQWKGTLAVVGDPVFSLEDPRVQRHGTVPSPSGIPVAEDLHAPPLPLLALPRLRFSRGEALDIAAMVPAEERLLALDFAASRELITGGGLGGYRLLHLATHGVLDDRHPELSGVVLSLVDEAGEPREGFLRLYEIYRLELAADLVTLSACQTALGKDVAGEGLLGLPRGFLYAGVRRVVAGLWRVPDKATAELMRHFYRGMLEDRLSPAEALRQAQLTLLEGGRWDRSYYWAAFVLQGEWR